MTYTPADIDDLLKYLDEITVDENNKLDFMFTMKERDLLIDALIFYKEMNTY